MLVNDKPLRRVNTSDKTLGWPVSTTESFFMDGERQEQEGWDLAKLQASEPDPERMFTSFDRVPRNRWPMLVVAMLALLLIGAVASARIPAARDLRRRTIATVGSWLPPMHWPPPHTTRVAPAAVAAVTPAEPVAPVPAPPAAAPTIVASTAPPAPEATAPPVAVAAPVLAPAPVAAQSAPEPRAAAAPLAKAAPSSVSLLPWKETGDSAASTASRGKPSSSAATPSLTAAVPRRSRASGSTSSGHHGMVWSPQAMTLVPSTPSDSAPDIIPPSNTDTAPVAAAPSPPPSRSTAGMGSPSTIEPPTFQAPPSERPAPSTEPAPLNKDDKDKAAPIIE